MTLFTDAVQQQFEPAVRVKQRLLVFYKANKQPYNLPKKQLTGDPVINYRSSVNNFLKVFEDDSLVLILIEKK